MVPWEGGCMGGWRVYNISLIDIDYVAVKAGADPKLEDDQGSNASAIAFEHGHDAVVALIDVRL